MLVSLALKVNQGWMGFQGEMGLRVNLDSKGNPPRRASRVNAGPRETLVLLEPLGTRVHLVCQGLAVPESRERKAVRVDLDFLEVLDYLGLKVSRVKV